MDAGSGAWLGARHFAGCKGEFGREAAGAHYRFGDLSFHVSEDRKFAVHPRLAHANGAAGTRAWRYGTFTVSAIWSISRRIASTSSKGPIVKNITYAFSPTILKLYSASVRSPAPNVAR